MKKILSVVIIGLLVFGLYSCMSGSNEKKDYSKFNLKKYQNDYIVSVTAVADHYTDYKFNDYKWEFKDFTSKNDGVVYATYLDNTVCIFSYDGNEETGHYFYFNGRVYLNDGKFNDKLKLLGLPTK